MEPSPARKDSPLQDPVQILQQDIAALETELKALKSQLAPFEAEIRLRLDNEMARIRTLTELYKKLKKDKKAKRLEQKRKGKNYKEPTRLPQPVKSTEAASALEQEEQKELKRLYKEAIVQFHPDKVNHKGEADKIERATAITARLNNIYKQGDLEELLHFYQFLMNGHEVKGYYVDPADTVDRNVRLAALKKKKEVIKQHIVELKNSYLYTVLTSYDNPATFIDELQLQFRARIEQLEKRTRKA